MTEITEQTLEILRKDISSRMSPKRFRHTAAVEDMVARLGALFCPEYVLPLRAAALLHDLTKEKSTQEQIEMCQAFGLTVSDNDRFAPKTFHARTAAAMIPREFPHFSDPLIVDAVRWHTTGRADMTLTEQLLYLADYIDDSRTFENCVLLRHLFWDAEPERMDTAARRELLYQTLLLSYDMTIRDLLSEGLPIAEETVQARNALIAKLKDTERS